jgi:MFS family permease
MLRGPITKVISESTNIKYARVICTILNMAGFGGPVVASLLSLIFYWRTVFILTGLATVAIGIIMFTVLALLSKKGKINFKRDESKGIKSLFEVFKLENFIFFMTMSAISEVANTSITFWIPTYTIEFLGFSQKMLQ